MTKKNKKYFIKTLLVLIIIGLLIILSCTMPAVSNSKNKSDSEVKISNNDQSKAIVTKVDPYTKEYGPFDCFWFNAKHNWVTSSVTNDQDRILIADMQTRNGSDVCSLRFDNTSSKIKAMVQEEKSYDDEIEHSYEIVGGFLVDNGVIRNSSGDIIGTAISTNVEQESENQEHTINLFWPLGTPVAFAVIRTYNSSDPAHVRVIEVTKTSNIACRITFNIEEWRYQDGIHVEEQIDFVVLEKGIHRVGSLPFGGDPYLLEVGQYTPDDNNLEDKKVKLLTHFDTVPLVISQSQTLNGSHEIITRNKNIDTEDESFIVRMYEEQSRWADDTTHKPEVIGYLALGKGDHTYGRRSNVVNENGHLQVINNNLCNEDGDPVQFKGMSLFWQNWEEGYKFANHNLIEWLVHDWEIDILRIPVGVRPIKPDMSGELIEPRTGIVQEMNDGYSWENAPSFIRACDLIEKCIDRGIYVIVDWHVHDAYYGNSDGGGLSNDNYAATFFLKMSERYGAYPNVIFEIWNEPGTIGHKDGEPNYQWQSSPDSGVRDIKSYSENIIEIIRDNDPDNNDNIVIVPTPQWDQLPTYIYTDHSGTPSTPLNDDHVLYTFHFYAGSHTPRGYDAEELGLPDGSEVGGLEYQPNSGPGNAFYAARNEIPMFVTEWGTSLYDGGQESTSLDAYLDSSDAWIDLMEANNISWCNWSISDKNEGASALKPGSSIYGHWSKWTLSKSGEYIRGKIKE